MLASIRDAVTLLGTGQIPLFNNQLRRIVAPWTLYFSAMEVITLFSRKWEPAVPPRGEYAWGTMSFFLSQVTSSTWGHWRDSSTWSGTKSAGAKPHVGSGFTGNRLDAGLFEELLGPVDVEVGDSDRFTQTVVNELLHLPPSGGDILAEGKVELDLPVGRLHAVLLQGKDTLGCVNLEVDLAGCKHIYGVLGGTEIHVPVHEVEVKVVGAELLERVLEGHLDVLRVVVVLEELGSDPDLLARHAGVLDPLADLLLVLVAPRTARKGSAFWMWTVTMYVLDVTATRLRDRSSASRPGDLSSRTDLDGMLNSLRYLSLTTSVVSF